MSTILGAIHFAVQTIPHFLEAAETVFRQIRDGFANKKHAAQWITTLRTYIFPDLGSRPVDELTPHHFAEALRPIWFVKSETAERVAQRCDKVMRWAAANGYIAASPL